MRDILLNYIKRNPPEYLKNRFKEISNENSCELFSLLYDFIELQDTDVLYSDLCIEFKRNILLLVDDSINFQDFPSALNQLKICYENFLRKVALYKFGSESEEYSGKKEHVGYRNASIAGFIKGSVERKNGKGFIEISPILDNSKSSFLFYNKI